MKEDLDIEEFEEDEFLDDIDALDLDP